ncbi:MAG: PAS domain S-box protein [Desulfovibrionaceae bacterium]|jgi:histidine kinase|nr:PAS domain S-box protein [Desulfovibrionaceae bacterium]
MKRLMGVSLQRKILLSFLLVTMVLSVSIAFLARWILVSSLESELELRGSAIAHSIAEHGASYVLDKDYPKLLNLIVEEAQLGERENLVAYIFITDAAGEIISNTFIHPFPPGLRTANLLPEDPDRGPWAKSLKEVVVDGKVSYDIAVPIKEGLYRIGTVHVGLSKNHMDRLVGKLRYTFLGFISAIVIISFGVSHYLSRSIVQPLTSLTHVADEISRGNFDVMLEAPGRAGNKESWDPTACSAYMNTDLPCWHFDQSAYDSEQHPVAHRCKTCKFYQKRPGDEVIQLEDSFRNMFWSIKLYRRRLRESEEKYRSLFDSGPDPIFVVGMDGWEILDVNPRAMEVYAYSKEELLGQSFLMLGPDHERDYPLFGDPEQRATGCVYYPKVIHFQKGGKPLFVNAHACPITYQGRAAVIIATADITEMIEKDAQLVQAAKMKSLGEMSAGVAHEINQPLNAIQLGCELLSFYREQHRPIPEEQMDKVLGSITSQVERSKEIIDNLRAFGRKSDIFKEAVNVNTPILRVLSIIRMQFELDNIHFQLELGEDLPTVLAHDNRLQQVFFNLFNNARDAINENGPRGPRKIRIRTLAEDGQVVAEVADTGPGVPESVKNKIFEPFFTTKGVGKGTGLGLAITFGIVRDYGGGIAVATEPDWGAVFRLTFPTAA